VGKCESEFANSVRNVPPPEKLELTYAAFSNISQLSVFWRDRNGTVGELVLRDDGMQMTWIGRVWAPQAVVDLAV